MISFRRIRRQLVGPATAAAMTLMVATTDARGTVITFSDTDFADADWSTFELRDDTPNDSFVFSAARQASGGNPGAFRQVTHELSTPTASKIQSGHLLLSAVFDPGGNGTFSSLAFSFEGIGISGPAGAMGFGLLLRQGMDFFTVGTPQVLNGQGFQARVGTNLTAADFFAVNGGILDLSDSGAPVTFGFFASNGTFGQPSINVGGIDNYSVSITTTSPPTAVPAPATLPLLATGLVGLAVVGRRRRAS